MYNTLLIKRRLLSSPNTGIPTLSGGELAYSEKTSELYYGAGAPGSEYTITIGGSGAYVTVNNPEVQQIFGQKSFHQAVTLSGANFKDQVVVSGQLQASAVNVQNKLTVEGDALVKGNLTVEGTTTQIDTNIIATSSVSVTNLGTGPALTVTQLGDEAIAAFYDDSNAVALYVDGHAGRAGNVGIGTSTPDAKLTVVGNISASGNVTAYGITFDGPAVFNNSATIFGNLSANPNGTSLLEGWIIDCGSF